MQDNVGVKTAGLLLCALLACAPCLGQDLTPRACVITPIHSNAVVLTNSFFPGNLMFNGAVPITDATADVNAPIFNLYHSFNFFGRSANITASLPYGAGNFKGTVLGSETTVRNGAGFQPSDLAGVRKPGASPQAGMKPRLRRLPAVQASRDAPSALN